MKKYSLYKAFGKVVKSEYEFSWLQPCNTQQNIDCIEVEMGICPKEVENKLIYSNPLVQLSDSEYLFHLDNVVKLYVKDGELILVEPLTTNLNLIELYLCNNALPIAIMQQQQQVSGYTGVVLPSDEVLLLHGRKSINVALSLVENTACAFFSSDVSMQLKNNSLFCTASFPKVDLWKKDIGKQSVFNSEKSVKVVDESNKHVCLYHDTFIEEPKPIAAIVNLDDRSSINSFQKSTATSYLETVSTFMKHREVQQKIMSPKKHFLLNTTVVKQNVFFTLNYKTANDALNLLNQHFILN